MTMEQLQALGVRVESGCTKIPGGCWLWNGPRVHGYGYVCAHGATHRAHRVAWQARYLASVLPWIDVCHTCDVRNCCNPDHLWLGTRKDNMVDCKTKGRTFHLGRAGIQPPIKDVCRLGHKLIPRGNLPGKRRCPDCYRAFASRANERAKNRRRQKGEVPR